MASAQNSPETLAQQKRVDAARDQFEAAGWRDEQPRIESYLADALPEDQSLLLRGLLFCELARTPPGDNQVAREGYLGRFPEHRDLIEQIFSDDFSLRNQAPPDGGADGALAPTESSGTIVAGRYRLLEPIGEGGMGTVWRAEQRAPVKRHVALKLIKLGMNSKEVIARFEAERQLLALMDHPNIAKVLDGGNSEQGCPFFVMELVKGIPLHLYCDAHRLSIKDRLELFLQICDAVQHAHQKGIVHRDLNPANILVAEVDDQPVPKVIDFGLAKALQGSVLLTEHTLFTAFGSILGTPSYMSPEQFGVNALDVDTRSDVYSLGAVLYKLLTGTTPLELAQLNGKAWDELSRLVREVEPPPPSVRLGASPILNSIAASRQIEPEKLKKLVRGDLDWIALKALEKDRQRRYATVTGLSRDVQRFLADEPVEACPPSAGYRLRKFARRNRPFMLAAGVVASALILGVIGTSFGLVRARQQERVAKEARSIADQQRAGAEKARDAADQASKVALHAAARTDARYYLQESQLATALRRAKDAFQLGGAYEDGLLIDDVVKASRLNWSLLTALQPNRGVEPATATFASADGNELLVVAAGSQLQAYEARTGELMATASTNSPKHLIAPRRPAQGLVVVQSEGRLTSYRLPSLQVAATREFEHHIEAVSAAEHELLAIEDQKLARILDFETLADRAEKDSKDEKEYAANWRQGAISPDGSLVVLVDTTLNNPAKIWNPKTDRMTNVGLYRQRRSELDFINNTVVASWFTTFYGGATDDDVMLVDLSDSPPRVTDRIRVPGSDTKEPIELQHWQSDGKSMLGLRGRWGALLCQDHQVTDSVRYNNLWPFESEPPTALCASLANGLLALQVNDKVLIFQRKAEDSRLRFEDCCVTSITSGTLTVTPNFRLTYRPIALTDDEIVVQLHNPYEERCVPWAVAATPDGTTVALVVQETEAARNTGGETYFQTRVIVYHPGGWLQAKEQEKWKVPANTFELALPPPSTAWDFREFTLAPDGSALCYATLQGLVRHAIDGKPLGSSDEWRVMCRSADGNLLAGATPDGMIRYLNVTTGKMSDVQRRPGVSAMCFTPDNAGLIVGNGESLARYSLNTAVTEWSIPSKLLPLAWPASGDRFVALQPGQISGDMGKFCDVVLADRNSGQVVTILSQVGSTSTSAAAFSPNELQIVLQEMGRGAEAFRNTSPSEAEVFLRGPAPLTSQMVAAETSLPSAPAAEVATPLKADDIEQLRQHLGEEVSVSGQVLYVHWTKSHNTVTVEFEGPAENRLLMWVPKQALPELVKAMDGDVEKLAGADIVIRGKPKLYAGYSKTWANRLEIEFENPSQLQVVALASSPSPVTANPAAVVATVLSASDLELLHKHLGEEVTISGRVLNVSWTASQTAVNVEFDGPEATRLMIWVPSSALREFTKAMDGEVEKLVGADIVMRGKLGAYRGLNREWGDRLQIDFKRASQLQVTELATSLNPAAAPSPAAAATVLNASDLELLHKHLGEEVTVAGQVQQVSWTTSKTGASVEFDGPDEGRLIIWVPSSALRGFTKAMDGDLEKLVGADIVMRGKLHSYSGHSKAWTNRLQIDLKLPSQLQVVSLASAPSPAAAAATVLNGSDTELLHKHLGEEVTVSGLVRNVNRTVSQTAVNVEFDGPEETRLMIWVPPSALPALKKAVGVDLEKALTGARITMRGKLLAYGGKEKKWSERLQIVFTSPDQLQIVTAPVSGG